MKLTYEVPGILIDNTKSESIVELVTKTSSSLQQSGTFLVSEGGGDYSLKTFADITSSLIHDVNAVGPLAVDKTDKIRPEVYINNPIPVSLGGTGKESVENNKFLYGKGGEYKFVDIVGSYDDWITVEKNSITDDTIIKSTIFTIEQEKSKFIASRSDIDSPPIFRNIVSDDIPVTLNNKILDNVETSGTHEGHFSGTFEGDGSGLHSINVGNFAGTLSVSHGGTGRDTLPVRGILIGNGANPINHLQGNSSSHEKFIIWNDNLSQFELRSLSSSYFSNFDGDVYHHLSGGAGINISQNSNKVVISAGLSSVLTTGSVTGSGKLGNEIDLKPDIQVTSLTASNITLSNNLYVNGTASIAFLETLQQQSLQIGDKYITILSGANNHTSLDGAGILWGSGSNDGTTGDQESVAYVLYRGIGTNADYIEIFPGLRVSGTLDVTGGITGSFSGSASGLTGIPSTAVDLSDYATLTGVSSTYATLTGVSGTFTSASQVEDIISTFAQNKFARLDIDNNFNSNQYVTGSVSASYGITGSFSGSGALLNSLSASNWTPNSFADDVRAQLSAGTNLTYSAGVYSLKNSINLGSVTASFSGSGFKLFDLTGSGWGPQHSFADDVHNQLSAGSNLTYLTGVYRLNDDIELNSVSASFSGSGYYVYDITSSNIQNFTSDVHNKFVAESNLTYTTSSLSASYKLNNNIELNSVTASFKGDGSSLTNIYPKVRFTVTGDAGISEGHAVALTSTGLQRCDKAYLEKSNFIGIVVHSSSGELYVQTSGEADMSGALQGTFTTGTVLWLHHNGHAGTYSLIDPGEYATQVGYISGNGPYKVIIQPRVFGQLS